MRLFNLSLRFKYTVFSRYTFRATLFILVCISVFSGCKAGEPLTTTPLEIDMDVSEPIQVEQDEPLFRRIDVDSLMSNMTLREKIGQLFTIPAYGTFRNESDSGFMEWKRLIENYHIGGIIFMSGDIYGQAVLTNRFQELTKIPLWISQDMEYGAAMRLQGTTRFTPAMGVAATGDPRNAFLQGQVTAREAKALGVHQIYAPVLDVNNNPENPVINVRSFSSDPEMVAEYGIAFIRGVESEGLVATAKHFPGHGDTDTDSHLALPVIHHNYDRLSSIELYPFQRAINMGLTSIMSAHIAFPSISSNPETPSTLDQDILQGILVDSLGFNGLVVTDGLEMSGIASRYSPGEAVVEALKAGADVMLISPDEMTAVFEVEQAVLAGELLEERLDQSVRKILTLKLDHGLFESHGIDLSSLARQISTPDHQAIAGKIARESVTVVKNQRNIIPIREQNFPRILYVAVSDDESGSTGSSFATELRKYHPNVEFRVLDLRTSDDEKEVILNRARNADLLVIGSFITVRSHQPIQLRPDQITFLQDLTSFGKPSLLVAFGNPYVLQDLPDVDAHVLAWSGASQQVQSSTPSLFSGSEITGRLPISIPGLYEFGEGLLLPHSGLRFDLPTSVGLMSDSLQVIDSIMQNAIEDSVFPGGVVAVVKDGAIAWHKGYGYHDYNKTRAVAATDVYDVASITKVMSTTTSVMKLAEENIIRLDDPVANYIEEFNTTEKQSVTIRHLLLHTSGLPAFRVYVDRLKTREEILEAVKNEPLINSPGEVYVYSDLGFILLAEIVQEVTGESIDRYVLNNFFIPMGMNSAKFNPSNLGQWMSGRIPPTEVDTLYGRGIIQGFVHDERAWFMDGVAGHAGLFASARDIANWAQMLLNKGTFIGRDYLLPETVDLFTGHRSPINERGYGFDRKSEEGPSSAGMLMSSQTFGHLGFTGTSVWVDPESDIAIILLTNRTFPDRNAGTGIRDIRPAIADAVMKSIINQLPLEF